METFTDDIVVALASFLSPHDMLSLALSCKRFGDKNGTDKKQSAASREVRDRGQTKNGINIINGSCSTHGTSTSYQKDGGRKECFNEK